LPDAPPGTAGISLFLVPKVLGAKANDLVVAGLEKKLGLHGAPTCTMIYGGSGDGATGWLIGEENRGLACMFTMMNMSRLNVGIQGVGVAERAYQQALAYARQRRQGRAPGAPRGSSSTIIDHPDVQRMLMRMKALTAASRAICYACAAAIDMSHAGPENEREAWTNRVGLLTPIAKAFSTEAAVEGASLGIQVHGGAGYIEETGAAQHLRDSRIFTIYEGTNGIQAIDLVTRKLGLADGATVKAMIEEIAGIGGEVSQLNRPDLGRCGARITAAAEDLAGATDFLIAALKANRRAEALAGATPYLRLFGLALGGALLAKAALTDRDASRGNTVALARFFAETFVLETAALAATVIDGAEGLSHAAATFFTQAKLRHRG
jgi:hypothetical protein